MRPSARRAALERMEALMERAARHARSDPALSGRYAFLARRISTRHRVRMPYVMRMMFCKRCKSFVVPGLGSRVRVGRAAARSVRITCLFCGHTYRKVLGPPT